MIENHALAQEAWHGMLFGLGVGLWEGSAFSLFFFYDCHFD
jgi:hypothetical protein